MGSVVQVSARGEQDLYISAEPQFTFFKMVYKRHTSFAIETMEHPLNNSPAFGRKSTGLIVRAADLATKVYLKVVLPKTDPTPGCEWGYVRRLGHALIKSVELDIGGSTIDTQYGIWMDIWHELTSSPGHDRGYAKIIGDVPELTDITSEGKPEYTLYIPLQFWFSRNYGQAIPLAALHFHESRCKLEIESFRNLINYRVSEGCSPPKNVAIQDASLVIDYVFLSEAEREKFSLAGHEYLIEFLQFSGAESAKDQRAKIKLNFNHPTKELIWVSTSGRYCGEKFLGRTPDEFAVELVKAQLVLAPPGTKVNLGNGSAISGALDTNPKIIVDAGDNDVSLLTNEDSQNTANVGSLFSKISAATLSVRGLTPDRVHVLHVTHSITYDDIEPLSIIPDKRAMSLTASTYDTGIVVNDSLNYGVRIDRTKNPIVSAGIRVNNHERVRETGGEFYNYIQPMQHHSRTPSDGINVYSFAIRPEHYQPSGSINFSRIDNTELFLRFDKNYAHQNNKLYIFAVSYNIIRIVGGMGAILFSN